MMKKIYYIIACFMAAACTSEDFPGLQDSGCGQISIKLSGDSYNGECMKSGNEGTGFDFVDFSIMDSDGYPVSGIMAQYRPETGELTAAGLHEGNYTLSILAVRGDYMLDEALISKPDHISGVWLSFPADKDTPLQCEYFFVSRPFSVTSEKTPDGLKPETDLPESMSLKRIVGRIDFNPVFNNPYVRTASIRSDVTLAPASYYTSLHADGQLSGQSASEIRPLSLDESLTYYFMPTIESESKSAPAKGSISMLTRNYLGEEILRTYSFDQIPVTANYRTRVNLKITHPDDSRGTLFVTERAYAESGPALILQDDEHHSIYTDQTKRSFNTTRPLQLGFVEKDGQKKFHLRFYSPREITDVLIRLRNPAISSEYVDFAYLDSIPAFGDAYLDIPLLEKTAVFRTESGKQIRVDRLSWEDLVKSELQIISDDPYWKKLSEIRYGYEAYFDLYGGDPLRPDGGGNGKWKAIRPVHCREAVAFLLNYSYMLGLPALDRLIYDNADKLYADNGSKVAPELVLAQMRQGYRLRVGLIDGTDSYLGLGGPDGTYGVRQDRFTHHYDNYVYAETMVHELGHVMGYGHSSAFTYGPWAQELVNRFYIDHLSEYPVDSPVYLNSRSNPNLYPYN